MRVPSSVKGAFRSFSGQETQCLRLLEAGAAREEVAYAVYDAARLSSFVGRVRTVRCETALLSGSVAESRLLRTLLEQRLGWTLLYAPSGLSGDNAVGAALLARDRFLEGR